MNVELKEGMKIKCIEKNFQNLTYGKVYAVYYNLGDSKFTIVNDKGYYQVFEVTKLNDYFKLLVDPIVESVKEKYSERSSVGIEKYGITLHENDKDDFLKHLQEELMDATLYLEKLKSINPTNVQGKILSWANERELLRPVNKWKQYAKLQEESNELYIAMIDGNKEEIKDALGDCVVVLTILAHQCGFDLEDCTKAAYEVIKNRKGKTISGTFIKEKEEEGAYLG